MDILFPHGNKPAQRCRLSATPGPTSIVIAAQVGLSPIMLACRLGNSSLVNMLVEDFGADLELQDKVRHMHYPQR